MVKINNPKIEAIGEVISIPSATIPAGARLLPCNGATVSRTLYKRLFEVIGTTFGAGDGSTTFNLPDYRGKFLRCMGGNSAGDFNTVQGDAIRNITGTATINYVVGGYSGAFKANKTSTVPFGGNGTSTTTNGINFDASLQVPTANENRPINQAINFFIRY